MKSEQVSVREIKVAPGRLKPDEKIVTQLMESITKTGLINPITLCRTGSALFLVAGGNRFEAHRRLKLPTIAARVEEGDTPEVRQWRELAEIDENLIRRDLGVAQRAKITARRKVIYDIVNPDAPRIGQRAPGRPLSFAKDAAQKTGRNIKNVQQDTRFGLHLGDDLDRISGTSLDHVPELRALVKMSSIERKELVGRAAKGEKVSALKPREPDEDAPTREEINDANTTARSRIFLRFASDTLRKLEQGAGLKKSKRREISPEIKKALNDLVRACTKLRDEVINRKE